MPTGPTVSFAVEKAMTTDALKLGHTLGTNAGRVADTSAHTARSPHGPDPGTTSNKSDRIEVSEAARALQDQITRDQPPASQLPPTRLGELLRRLNSGYYDQLHVVNTVVSRVSHDL